MNQTQQQPKAQVLSAHSHEPALRKRKFFIGLSIATFGIVSFIGAMLMMVSRYQ